MMLWLLIAGLLVLATGFFIYPFFSNEKIAQGEILQTNVDVFRDQQNQLQAQLEQKHISTAQYEQLLAEAKQLLLANTDDQDAKKPIQPEPIQGKKLLPILILLVPCFCFAVYFNIGASADHRIVQLIQQASKSRDKLQATELQAALYTAVEKRTQQRPENIYYWILLAKRAIQQNDLVAAKYNYSKAVELSPDDGYLLAQYAEILFMLTNSQFTDEVLSVLDRAFAIDSSNPTVLGLKGIQAFDSQQWQLAITYWHEAQRQMDQNSATANALKAGIARAQKRLGIESQSGISSPQVELEVSIDQSISFNPEQSVFVALVATTGAPMPLAARKLRAGDLPTIITLSNADAVMAGYNLSSASEVKAVARLSQTGSATPQAGDWEDSVDSLDLSAEKRTVSLQISRQIGMD